MLRDYDCPDYFPMYEKAQELDLPILLHMGVIGGGIDYAITHPRRDPKAAESYNRWTSSPQMSQGRNISATRMRPFHLDTIANNFPRLRLIGAHLGGTGNYDEAASVARWRHNVFFDFSGGTTIERHAVERGLIGREIGYEKLIFGSDCSPARSPSTSTAGTPSSSSSTSPRTAASACGGRTAPRSTASNPPPGSPPNRRPDPRCYVAQSARPDHRAQRRGDLPPRTRRLGRLQVGSPPRRYVVKSARPVSTRTARACTNPKPPVPLRETGRG